jgi:hypothetical protein
VILYPRCQISGVAREPPVSLDPRGYLPLDTPQERFVGDPRTLALDPWRLCRDHVEWGQCQCRSSRVRRSKRAGDVQRQRSRSEREKGEAGVSRWFGEPVDENLFHCF